MSRLRWARWIAFAAFVGLNVAAFLHAWALTHFHASGPPTPPAHRLSTWQRGRVLMTGARIPRRLDVHTPAERGLAFESLVIAGSTGRLSAWRVTPTERRGTVVAFHGHAGGKSDLLAEIEAFHDLGFEVLAVDFPGSGGSFGEKTSIGFHEAGDVMAAFDQANRLRSGTPIFLYGESMGAAAVLKAVADRQLPAAGLILEAPFDSLLTTTAHRFHEMRLPAFPAAHLLVFWGGLQHGYNGFAHEPRRYAKRVSRPTLIVQGDRDPYVTLEESRAILEALEGPREWLVCEGVPHASCLRARGIRWRETVSRFLDRWSAQTS